MQVGDTIVTTSPVIATGPFVFDRAGNLYSSVQFDDGSVLRDVATDGMLDRFLYSEPSRELVFSHSPCVLLSATDVEGRVFRVDPAFIAVRRGQLAYQGISSLIFGIVFALLIVGLPFLVIGLLRLTAMRSWGRVGRAARRLQRNQPTT